MDTAQILSNIFKKISFVLIGFLFLAASSISIPANPIKYEHEYRSYYSVHLKNVTNNKNEHPARADMKRLYVCLVIVHCNI